MPLIVKVYVDGSSRGNPGPAGIGIVVANQDDKVLLEHSEFLGSNFTNNQAEYMALMRALDICSSLFPKGILHVFSDSELLVKQLTGQYNVRSQSLKELFREVRNKEKHFSKVYYHHVDRKHNRRADELANKALEESVR
ncbi:MAG: ribonuclease HI family protein [Candidatus Nezhaarchaeales archaeon]|nr:MAG: ribonuclease H [Candidatus Nezhaarchaeota archaeon WYZ-LMO8]TDA37095.1 MAG: ribonuclease H [Candidatus Nezhaarchaeota archaeon WYZ-LMO7]